MASGRGVPGPFPAHLRHRALLQVRRGHVVERVGECGLEAQRGGVVHEGQVHRPQLLQRVGQVGVRLIVGWGEGQQSKGGWGLSGPGEEDDPWTDSRPGQTAATGPSCRSSWRVASRCVRRCRGKHGAEAGRQQPAWCSPGVPGCGPPGQRCHPERLTSAREGLSSMAWSLAATLSRNCPSW